MELGKTKQNLHMAQTQTGVWHLNHPVVFSIHLILSYDLLPFLKAI